MSRPKLALPYHQHFDLVFPQLHQIVEILILRDIKLLPANLSDYSQVKAYHTNGLVDRQFAQNMTDNFISLLNKNEVFHISFDCGPSCRDVYFNAEKNHCYWPKDSSETLQPNQIMQIAKQRTNIIRKIFEGTIALENLDYHPGGAYEYVCEPEFISRLLRELDVYLVLDIAHALITSHSFGIDPIKYISRLPLELVREVHLSHPKQTQDSHDCPEAVEYELLGHILKHCRPEFVMLEYYQDPAKIIEENFKLSNFLKRQEVYAKD